MAYSTITKPSLYFNTKLYTGNNTGQSITGVGFQPDWVWIKSRTDTNSHNSWDSVRGVNKYLENDTTKVETTVTNGVTAFGTDGFTVGDRDAINDNGLSLVSWNWKANGAGSANTSGSINSTVSVNTTAGFSIVSFTGTGANATVGHGLGVAPKVIITKSRANAENWGFYHETLGNTKQLVLNTTGALTGASSAYYNNTSPTSTLFSVGTADSTNDAANMIAYCFAEKTGYSKFGSYTGNNNANGTFVYTGFKPAFAIIKDTAARSWIMVDNKRNTFNVVNNRLFPDATDAQNTGVNALDFLSNGFKIRSDNSSVNVSGNTYIYMAFAAEPLVANVGASIPATAR